MIDKFLTADDAFKMACWAKIPELIKSRIASHAEYGVYQISIFEVNHPKTFKSFYNPEVIDSLKKLGYKVSTKSDIIDGEYSEYIVMTISWEK